MSTPITATIQHVATGEQRTFTADWLTLDDAGDRDGIRYQWTEGNFGCDCNRAHFFATACGEDEFDDTCGEKRFLVRLAVDDDVLMDELEDGRE